MDDDHTDDENEDENDDRCQCWKYLTWPFGSGELKIFFNEDS
jgi:hypothetical protein